MIDAPKCEIRIQLKAEIAQALHNHLKWDEDTPDDEFACCADDVLDLPLMKALINCGETDRSYDKPEGDLAAPIKEFIGWWAP